MQPAAQELAESYSKLSEIEIASLEADADSLTETARSALANEIQRRGLNKARLLKLHASEVRREEKLDRVESERRKQIAYVLVFSGGDWRWAVGLGIAALGAVLIFELFSLLR